MKYKTKAYGVYASMKSRCYNPNYKDYPEYGGRGILIDSSWDSFDKFYSDMGNPPEGMSLERLDNDKGYSKENCKWATSKEQAFNRRSTIKITRDGVTKSLKDWCRELNLLEDYGCIRGRIQDKGWDSEKALTTPTYRQYKLENGF